MIRQPELSIVLFEAAQRGAEDYDSWSAAALADQIGFVTPTKWEGQTVARFAFLHPHTTVEIVEEILRDHGAIFHDDYGCIRAVCGLQNADPGKAAPKKV